LDTNAIKKRFEKLVSLNIEGIASTEDNLELWEMLRQHSNLKAEFIQTRHIHYLLKISCDPSASEMVFASRFKDALQIHELIGKDLPGSVQDRLIKVVQKKKKRKFIYPILKIAASILIILGCAVLCKNLFFQTQTRFAEISKSDETYLDWNYELQIVELKKSITMFYGAPTPATYLYAGSENEIIKKSEKINEMINRSVKSWP
jgi:hypothetical protein